MALVADLQDRAPRTKPFLGGWRNSVTGLIYHNACTQTRGDGATRRCGIAQTVSLVDAITEVVHDRAVQVHFLPDVRDVFIVPGIFSPSATPEDAAGIAPLSRQRDSAIVDSVVKIQKCYRAYRARAIAGQIDEAPPDDDDDDDDEANGQRATPSSARGADVATVRRGEPRTSSDFATLHNLVDRWRILETERTSRELVGASRIAACGLILSREIELLRAIEALKSAARRRWRERRRRGFLDEMSRPIAWRDSRGRPILVETMRAQRARQHRSVYASLANEELSVPERVDLLHGLRRVAAMHTCDQSRELVYLVDQELALLARRVDTSRLDWLRNRLKLSFLKLARNALQGDLEEDALRFGWSDASITRLCRTCGRLLPLEKFPRERRLRSSTCVHCSRVGGSRVVYEPYESMLREVRRVEASTGCYGGLAFVIGAKVVCRLVNEIWHGRSGVSGCDDLDELRLTRFRRELEWAPWNSLLLTRTETAVHRALADIESFYDARLLQKFYVKNLQARLCFEAISDARGNVVTPSPVED